MSVSNESEYLNTLERFAQNLVSTNSEVRERACKSLILKLELNILSNESLLTNYHFIIRQCLFALNVSLEKLNKKFVSDILKIMRFFSQNEEGKNLLKKYGTVEFLGEYLEYHKSSKNGAIVDEIESFLYSILNKNVTSILASKNQPDIKSKKEMTQTERMTSMKMSTICMKTLFNCLDNKNIFSEYFGTCNSRKLSDSDRNIIVELTTMLKYSNNQEISVTSEIFHSILNVLEDFPIDIFFNNHSELFYEIIKAILATNSSVFRCTLMVTLISKLKNEIELFKMFSLKKNQEIEYLSSSRLEKQENESFILESYPLVVNNHQNDQVEYSQKLSFGNLIEIVMRLFINISEDSEFSYFISSKIKCFFKSLFSFSNSVEFQKIIQEKISSILGFWENNFFRKQNKENLISKYNFLVNITDLVIWIIKKLLISGIEKNPEMVRNLNRSFNFSHFNEWFIYGLYSLNKTDKISQILTLTDEKIQSDFRHLLSLKKIKELFINNFGCGNTKIWQKITSNDLITPIYSQATEVLAVFDFLDCDINEFFELFLIGQYFTRISLTNNLFSNEIIQIIEIYKEKFMNCAEKVLIKDENNKNKLYLLEAVSKNLRNNFSVNLLSKKALNFKDETIRFCTESLFLAKLILSELEASENDFQFYLKKVNEILIMIFEIKENLPEKLDLFILAAFVLKINENSQENKNFGNYLITKFPILGKATKILGIFSKGILFSYQSFNSLVYQIKGDFGLTTESVKKIQLLGMESETKIHATHHLFQIIDEKMNDFKFKNPLTVLSNLADSNQAIERSKIKEINDILDLFLNKNLEQTIRHNAINQCTEIMISLRKNREIRNFSASLANLATDRFIKEEMSVFTHNYVKLIIGFILFQKYNPSLKQTIIFRLRDYFQAENFKNLENIILLSCKKENIELKYNILCLIQLLFCSNFHFEVESQKNLTKREKIALKFNKKINIQSNIPEEQDEITSTSQSLKIKFWKYQKNDFFNFIGPKLFDFSQTIHSKGLPSELIQTICSNKGEFYEFVINSEVYFEAEIIKIKKLISDAHSIIDYLEINKIFIGLISFFDKYKSVIAKQRNIDKLSNNLKKISEVILVKFQNSLSNPKTFEIMTEMGYSFIFSFYEIRNQINISDFIYPIICSLINEINDIDINNKSKILKLLSFLVSFMPLSYQKSIFSENNIKFINLEFSSDEFHNFNKILINLPEKILQNNNIHILSILNKSLYNFSSFNSFSENQSKQRILKLFIILIKSIPSFKLSDIFDFFVRIKELTKSPCVYLRLISWLCLYSISHNVEDDKFIKELVYSCKLQIEGTCRNENSKINTLVFATFTKILNSNEKGKIEFDFNSFGKLLPFASNFSLNELTSFISLFIQMKKNTENHNLQNKMKHFEKQIIEIIFSQFLSFIVIKKCNNASNGPGYKKSRNIGNIQIEDLEDCEDFNFDFENSFLFPNCFFKITNITKEEADFFINEKDLIFSFSTKKDEVLYKIKGFYFAYQLFLEQFLKYLSLVDLSLYSNLNEKLLQLLMGLNFNQKKKIDFNQRISQKLISSIIVLINPQRMTKNGWLGFLFEMTEYLEQIPIFSNIQKPLDFICSQLYLFKQRYNDEEIDSLQKGDLIIVKIITKLVIQNIYEKTLRNEKNSFKNLEMLLSVSNKAKQAFLLSDFTEIHKQKINKYISEKNFNELHRYYDLFRSLFYSVEKNKQNDIKFYKDLKLEQNIDLDLEKIKNSLRYIFMTLCKTFVSDFDGKNNENIQEILKIYINWHLNPLLCRFPEKQTFKGKNTIINGIFDTLKNISRYTSFEYKMFMEFLQLVSSVSFITSQVCKSKLLTSYSQKIVDIYNNDKRDQFISTNLKIFQQISDLFYSFSFDRLSHSKIFENKSQFEAFEYFTLIILNKFKKVKKENFENEFKNNINSQKKIHCVEKMELSQEVKKLLILISNISISSSSKIFLVESQKLIENILDMLSYTTTTSDRLLISQIFYNFIFKDASCVKVLQKERFNLEISDLLIEIKQEFKRKNEMILIDLDFVDEEKMMQEKIISNVNSIQEIISL